jgi:hypothetical protein
MLGLLHSLNGALHRDNSRRTSEHMCVRGNVETSGLVAKLAPAIKDCVERPYKNAGLVTVLYMQGHIVDFETERNRD